MTTAEARRCPKCQRTAPPRLLRCMYCGSDLVGGPPPPIRSCPRCAAALGVQQVKCCVVDVCARCGGAFFDASEFERTALGYDASIERVLERGRTPPHDGVPGQPLTCPGCRAAMDSFRIDQSPPVLVDRCSHCRGLWLDRGEAPPLRTFVLRVSAEIARADRRLLPQAPKPRYRNREQRLLAERRQRQWSAIDNASDGIELGLGVASLLVDLLD